MNYPYKIIEPIENLIEKAISFGVVLLSLKNVYELVFIFVLPDIILKKQANLLCFQGLVCLFL